jgi:hypothetical protein
MAMEALKRRMIALKELLSLTSSTSKAIPYSQWNSPPNIIFESDIAKNFYYDL